MEFATYDKLAFKRASYIGWLEYARIYGPLMIRSGQKHQCVMPDSTQSTKMCLWHFTIGKEMKRDLTRS